MFGYCWVHLYTSVSQYLEGWYDSWFWVHRDTPGYRDLGIGVNHFDLVLTRFCKMIWVPERNRSTANIYPTITNELPMTTTTQRKSEKRRFRYDLVMFSIGFVHVRCDVSLFGIWCLWCPINNNHVWIIWTTNNNSTYAYTCYLYMSCHVFTSDVPDFNAMFT